MNDTTTRSAVDLCNKRVAITGATGFLGGYVLQAVRDAGGIAVALCDSKRKNSVHHALPTNVETHWFDKVEDLASTVKRVNANLVVHLHAAITTERSAAALRSTLATNFMASVDVMSTCLEMRTERLVLMGSGEEFGPVTGPFDDTTVPDPPSPYGASKAAVTCYARMFYRAFGLSVTVLRPSVVYGPRQSPRMLIPQVFEALAENRQVAVTAGQQTRDFIYADDVGRGVLFALTAPGVGGRSYNLGSGEVTTVKDCLLLMEQISGRTGLIQYGSLPYKAGEIFSYEPILEETFAALNWRPAISLQNGLELTWNALIADRKSCDLIRM